MADIEVMIKIPEEIYNMVMNTGTFGCYRFNTAKAIKNGTPLPKNHGRLIDANALKENYCDSNVYTNERGFWFYRVKDIIDAPTVVEADKESTDACSD